MKIKLLILLLSFLLLTSCTTVQPELNTQLNNYTSVETVKQKTITEMASITLWSWQIPTTEYARAYKDELLKTDFDSVEICMLWSDIEKEQGVFDFTQIDRVIDVFAEDYKISLSLLFWTEGLSWADSLDIMKTSEGEIYVYNDGIGAPICLNSEKNLRIISNTLQNFAAHFSDRYDGKISSWSVRFDCFGKSEYSPMTDLDYSEPALSAFYDYLEEKYVAIENLNDKYAYDYSSFDEIRTQENKAINERFEYEWRLFKQETIISVTNLAADIFIVADDSIPITLVLSSFRDTSAAFYRGVFDPYIVSRETKADIIQITDAPDWQHDFSIDMLTSLTQLYISTEIDGPWISEETTVEAQASTSKASGATILQTVNWELDDIINYGEFFSKTMKVEKEERPDADNTDVVLINTLDFLIRKPPHDMNSLYYYAYRNLKGKSDRKVRFITDTQLSESPELINDIEKIHLGSLNEVIYLRNDVAQLLAESNVIIVDDYSVQPNFLNEYGRPIDEDIQVTLRKKLKES